MNDFRLACSLLRTVTDHQPAIRPSVDASGQKGLPTFRWVICGLLFFATTINYVDRQVIGILATPLQKHIQCGFL